MGYRFPILLLLLLWKEIDLTGLIESNLKFAVLKAVAVLALEYLTEALLKAMAFHSFERSTETSLVCNLLFFELVLVVINLDFTHLTLLWKECKLLEMIFLDHLCSSWLKSRGILIS
jgi:hypothetical protein